MADVEAKRRLIDEHSTTFTSIWWPEAEACEVECCKTCSGDEHDPDEAVEHPCPTLRLLALPFADHPDYREEWRPRGTPV